jgi:hypothetical protein
MTHPALIIALASIAFAQSGNKLDADLLAQNNSQQIADDILSLTDTKPQPSRRVVLDFTDELTRALIGKRRSAENVANLGAAIVDVLRSDGVPTWKYRAFLDAARQTLVSMGVSQQGAQRVADRLRILGQQVRGPEDLPAASLQELRH